MTTYKRKLIEVAMPLEDINRESAREKSIRYGHPSTLHMWWARRPLAACRAVLFAQLVDDPSSHPEKFTTVEAQAIERNRLFDLIKKMVIWEQCNDPSLLAAISKEIRGSVGDPSLIKFLDPFAGGGSIPLEAQRLGLNSHASDLNPIPVLLNRCMLDFPSHFRDRPPVHPASRDLNIGTWPSALGLAEDIRLYANDIWEISLRALRRFYPEVGEEKSNAAPVVAWLWARTVTCPNPACGKKAPLVRNFWLSQKTRRKSWLEPKLTQEGVSFEVTKGNSGPSANPTVTRTGAKCLSCETAIPLSYIRKAGSEGKLGITPMSLVTEGNRQRVYSSSDSFIEPNNISIPKDLLDTNVPKDALGFRVHAYGLTKHSDLFTQRQLKTLSTYSHEVKKYHERIVKNALESGLNTVQAKEYAGIVATYLGIAVSRTAGSLSNLNTWNPAPSMETVNNVFKMQSLSMVWDFAESNPFREGPASLKSSAEWISRVLEKLPARPGESVQADAANRSYEDFVISTDPPYYDNVGYADLSDFFYVWLRQSLDFNKFSEFATVLTPKSAELIADPSRHEDASAANKFFEDGFYSVFKKMRLQARRDIPITVFYAFKQQETDGDGTVSSGWEALLEGMIKSGWQITATWPMRTERSGRPRDNKANALASSIVLACRARSEEAPVIARRPFVNQLKERLPAAMKNLQASSIAPVDLAQAAIGPGMSIFSEYSRILEVDGTDMSVRTALAIINQVLDEVLSEQEGDFDSDTRFCLKWFSQFGWNEASFGEAESLAKAVNTSIPGLERGGIFKAIAGKARLIHPEQMSGEWDPEHDKSISIWEVALRIAYALQNQGIQKAAEWNFAASKKVELDAVKELSYLLFSISEKKGWNEAAILFNGLGTSWSDINNEMHSTPKVLSEQSLLDFDEKQ
jgi:putative DNA methylase